VMVSIVVLIVRHWMGTQARHQDRLAQWVVYSIGVCSAYWLFERSALLFM